MLKAGLSKGKNLLNKGKEVATKSAEVVQKGVEVIKEVKNTEIGQKSISTVSQGAEMITQGVSKGLNVVADKIESSGDLGKEIVTKGKNIAQQGQEMALIGYDVISKGAEAMLEGESLLSVAGGGPSKAESEEPIIYYTDWMAGLEDETPLHQICIPGTHDSGALYDKFAFGFAKCQDWDIKQQLMAGIRFLDIRCRHISNTFAVHHGPVFQNLFFGDVVEICRWFLKANPSEAIVMRLQDEYEPSNNTETFAETLQKKYWDKDLFYTGKKEDPTLGEVRGRIYLIRNFHGGSFPGRHWCHVKRQDNYAPKSVKEKLEDILKFIESYCEEHFHVNFLSGLIMEVPAKNPRTFAKEVKPKALEMITKKCGIVAMDFPKEEDILKIIQLNELKILREVLQSPFHGKYHKDTKNFDDLYELGNLNMHKIMKIRVWHGKSYGGAVNGIQIEFRHRMTEKSFETAARFGDENLAGYEDLVLEYDEYITHVGTKHGSVIDGLQIITSKDKKLEVGKKGGSYDTFKIPQGYTLVGTFGGYGGLLHNFGIYVGKIQE